MTFCMDWENQSVSCLWTSQAWGMESQLGIWLACEIKAEMLVFRPVQVRVDFSHPRNGNNCQFINLGFVLDLEEPNTLGKVQQLWQGRGEAWSGGIWLEEPENHKAVEFSSVKSAGIFQTSLFGLRLFLVTMGDIHHHFYAICSCISQCWDTWALSFERKQLGKETAELQPLLGIFPK